MDSSSKSAPGLAGRHLITKPDQKPCWFKNPPMKNSDGYSEKHLWDLPDWL